jgi:hypothetical protein
VARGGGEEIFGGTKWNKTEQLEWPKVFGVVGLKMSEWPELSVFFGAGW